MTIPCRIFASVLLALSISPHVFAQQPEPIGPFAADIRAAFPRFKELSSVASALDVTTSDLPSRGFGLVFGAHVYPARIKIVTLGFGGELHFSRGSRTGEATSETEPPGPTVKTRFSSFAPQVSLNFGKRAGWSYISGGIGWSRYTTEREDDPLPDDGPRTKTINYGAGARWFAKKHLAFSIDLRFYAVNPQEETATRPAVPRTTFFVMNWGISLK